MKQNQKKMESTFSLFLFVIITGLVNGACPSKCRCSDYQHGTYVNCDRQSFEYIPTDFHRDAVYLNLGTNKIKEIDVQLCKEMPQLTSLMFAYRTNGDLNMTTNDVYLENNRLQSIQSYTFINMSQLYYLNLNRNNISHIEEHAFGKLPSLLDLYMAFNPFNCDCSVFSLWSWLTERLSIPFMGIAADCSNGTSIISLQSDALEICNPDNCKCFNGGKCLAIGSALVCDCIGQWTGDFCQESQCSSYDCGYGNCYIEPENGTAQCLYGDRYVNYCPGCDEKQMANDSIVTSLL